MKRMSEFYAVFRNGKYMLAQLSDLSLTELEQVVISMIGGAIPPELVDEVERRWSEYVERDAEKWDDKELGADERYVKPSKQ